MKRTKLLFIVLVALLLASFAPLPKQGQAPTQTPLPAPSPGISMTVKAAFDGNFKYGEWLPLYAEIENTGADVEAELQVRVGGGGDVGMVYTVPVPLPSGARKRVTVYALPNNFSRSLDVRLVSGSTLLASQLVQVRPQPNIAYMVGIVAAQRGALGLLSGVTLPGAERTKVLVDFGLEEMPERAEGLSAFNLLILNDVDTSKMTTQQGQALQGWVESGGRLVIGGGAGAQRTFAGLPESLRVVKLSGEENAGKDALDALASLANVGTISSSGDVLMAAGDAQGNKVLAAAGDRPVVVEKTVQKGWIDFVAFDLTAMPFEGWSGTQQFWLSLVKNGSAYPEQMPPDVSIRQMRGSSYYGALTSIPSLDLPSVRGLSILLGLYILVVGPVNYLILRRYKRLHLAWVTIPVITAVFTGGAFGLGYALRGNDLIINKVSLVEVQQDAPARVTTFVGLFSPAQQSYVVEVDSDSLLSTNNIYYGPDGSASTNREMELVQSRPALVKGLTVNQWSMQTFTAEDTWANFGTLTGDLRLEGETLKGTVTNNTAHTLKDAAIVIKQRFQRLGDIAPGQSVKVDLGLTSLNRDVNGPPLSYKMYQEPYSNQGMRLPRDVMTKSQILDNTFNGPAYMKFGVSSVAPSTGSLEGLVLFGWMDQAPPNVGIRGQETSQITTALVYTSLNLTLPESGQVALPVGMVPGRIVEMPRGMSTCGMSGSSIYLDNTDATFEFQVPPELSKYKISSLTLSLMHDNPQAVLKDLSIYRWDTKEWVSTSSWESQPWSNQNGQTGAEMPVPDAGQYVNGQGQVQVKISAGPNNQSCYYIDLGVRAESAAAGQGD